MPFGGANPRSAKIGNSSRAVDPVSSERTDTLGGSSAVARRGDRPRSRGEEIAEAVQSFQAGREREASFRFLYRSYFRPLRRFFAAKGMSPEACEDLTQETFLGIYKGLETYRHQMRFASWLYRLATNVYLKRLRAAGTAKRSGREVALDAELGAEAAADGPPDPLEDVIRSEELEAMRRAIRELPEQMRKCLTLRLYHEMSYQEIAVVMKLEVDTVRAHLFQARRRLRAELEGLDLEDL